MNRQDEVEKILALLKENCGECAEEAGWCLYFVSGILVDNGIRSKEGFEIAYKWPGYTPSGDTEKKIVPIQYKED